MFVDDLPLGPTGTVDVARLAAPRSVKSSIGGAPKTPTERKLFHHWQQLLQIDSLSIDDHFFALGGNSLLALQLVNALSDEFETQLPVGKLFESPTIRAIAKLLDEEQGQVLSIPKVADGILPLAVNQHVLWLLEQFEQGIAFNAPIAIRLSGSLDTSILNESLNRLIERHEILRTAIEVVGGRPVHQIQEPQDITLEVRDLRDTPADARELTANELGESLVRRRFKLADGRLIRFLLVRLEDETSILYVSVHHMVADGWSFPILVRDLSQLYESLLLGQSPRLPNLPIQFTDYAAWRVSDKTSDSIDNAYLPSEESTTKHPADVDSNYWRSTLREPLPVLELPIDFARTNQVVVEPDEIDIKVSAEVSAGLKAIAQQEGATLYMCLLAAYMTLLHRYSGQSDIIVGTATANRSQPETNDLIGFFAGALPIRGQIDPDATFLDFLAEIKSTCVAAFSSSDPRPDEVAANLRPPTAGRMPVFQAMFTFGEFPEEPLQTTSLLWQPFNFNVVRVSGFDIALSLRHDEESLAGSILFRPDLFETSSVERIRDSLLLILESAAQNPTRRLSQLALIDDATRHQLLVAWNDTDSSFPRNVCVHQLFQTQAERTPDATALVCNGTQVTYRELLDRVDSLAFRIVACEMTPEAPVCVLLERTPWLVAAMLAAMKAGHPYVPLDPSWPAERIAAIVREVTPPMILTQPKFAELLNSCTTLNAQKSDGQRTTPWEGRRIDVTDCGGDGPDDQPSLPLDSDTDWPVVTPDNLAYVIFTSGSTGTPKGVMIEHRSVVNVVHSFVTTYGLGTSDRVLQQTSPAFDVSVNEIFPVLSAGGTLVLAPDEASGDFDELAALIEREQVTILGATPSGLTELNRRSAELASVRLVLSGGEALAESHVDQLAQQAIVTNGYGPTETTICATYFRLPTESRGNSIPIGKPLPNYQVYVLDANQQLLPIGCAGELYIGGAGLARGYWNDPEMTQEKFLANPHDGGRRMYRTGDEVRWRSDGNLEFLGRIDRQIKIRGFRVELGEIESVLAGNPHVKHSVVVFDKDLAGHARLVAYASLLDASYGASEPASLTDEHSTRHDEAAWIAELRSYLAKTLPEYMVPSIIMLLREMPLTANGKIDVKALPQPRASRPDLVEPYVAPRCPEEEKMTAIWTTALGIDRVGINDNFFELGGHSLLAAQVMHEIHQQFQVDFSYKDFFETQNVAAVVQRIQSDTTHVASDNPLTANVPWQAFAAAAQAPQVDLFAEVELDESIQSAGKPHVDLTVAPESVLLTGASGFLGAFLLRDLAEHTEATIHCLVRADSADHALEKLGKNLTRYGLDASSILARVQPVVGDLARARLGLSKETFDILGNQIETIYHNGANVNFTFPYQALKGTNVDGTREILRLAAHRRVKPVHFVSTIPILQGSEFSGSVLRESDTFDRPDRIVSGYGQSKWVAERLVEQARQRGIPTVTFRPGRIAGDSVRGIGNADDLFATLLNMFIQLGRGPDFDMSFDLTPVDFVSRAIVEVSGNPQAIGSTCHLVNPRPLSWRSVVDAVRLDGYSVETVPVQQWVEEMSAMLGSEFEEMFANMAAFLGMSTLEAKDRKSSVDRMSNSKPPIYDASNTQRLLSNTGIECPVADASLLHKYFAHLRSIQTLPALSASAHA